MIAPGTTTTVDDIEAVPKEDRSVCRDTLSKRDYRRFDRKALKVTLDHLDGTKQRPMLRGKAGSPISINARVRKSVEKLSRVDPIFAQGVLGEAVMIAAERKAPIVTDSMRVLANQRLREDEAIHQGQPTRRERARGEEFCNRGEAESVTEDSEGNEDTFSVFETILTDIEMPRIKENDPLHGPMLLLPLLSKRGVTMYDIDPSRLSAEAQSLLNMLAVHADEMHQIEANVRLSKRQRTDKIQGVQRKFACAMSKLPAAVKVELEGALELEREAMGMGRFCEKAANSTDRPNSLIHRTDRNLRVDNAPCNAFERWKRKKAALNRAWSTYLSKMFGNDRGSIVKPKRPDPIRPESAIVIRRYKERALPVEYHPAPNITDEQHAENAGLCGGWEAYLDDGSGDSQALHAGYLR